VLGTLFIGYALLLGAKETIAGGLPNVANILLAMFGVALIANLAGRFIRDWTLVLAGVFAYMLTAQYTNHLDMPIYYSPQIDADRIIGLGSIPSEWLQQHLYHGRTGPLEIAAVALYFSHFVAPLLLAFYIWMRRLTGAFKELMFGILATSILADIIFVLFPTAPPWLAAEHGGLVNVHHLLKDSLLDLHLTSFASVIGNPDKYNVVAALPSMHAAFPVIALLVAVRYGLPKWLIVLQATQLVGVFFAIVYLGDHYVIDAIAGTACAVLGLAVVRRFLAQSIKTPALPMPQPELGVAATGGERPAALVLDGRS
jgi:hypothetical protein